MKKFLNILSTLALTSKSVIASTILTSINSDIKINNNNSNHSYNEMDIKSPVSTKSFLTTAGDWGTHQRKEAYTTINLGRMKPNQIMEIGSNLMIVIQNTK